MRAAIKESLARGIAYLARAQHPQGSWTDFWLPVGASDAWVTAYVGLALESAARALELDVAVREAAAGSARKAGEWLLARARPLGGWGYNANVYPDADSTAHALSLLARLGLEAPWDAVTFLQGHEVEAPLASGPAHGRAQGDASAQGGASEKGTVEGQCLAHPRGRSGRRARAPSLGYATYRFRDPLHQWTKPCVDVSAACLRALCDLGLLDAGGLAERWRAIVGVHQDARGWWHGYWWFSPNYATALALEVWRAAGGPALRRRFRLALPVGNAFDLACAVLAEIYGGPSAEAPGAVDGPAPGCEPLQHVESCPDDQPVSCDEGLHRLVRSLVRKQCRDGGWRSAPILRVPPSHPVAGGHRAPAEGLDARRLFVTATAVKALAAALGALPATERPAAKLPGAPHVAKAAACVVESDLCKEPELADAGQGGHARALRRLIVEAAEVAGLDTRASSRAGEVFAALTARSVIDPSPWPSEQLSVLSLGVPLEFSVTARATRRPALRYAVEVGDPYLPPFTRAVSGLEAIEEAACLLRYGDAWARLAQALKALVSPELQVPDGLRFWVWAGVDHVWAGAGRSGDDRARAPILKVYVNMLHREVPGSRRRLSLALEGAGIPLTPTLERIFDLLDGGGFVHEAGFALGPGGRIACKVYYELEGWRRDRVRQVLRMAGLKDDPGALCPEIPGVLTEGLAAKSRAGVALRLDPDSGEVKEVTTAAAFPPPMLSPGETIRRVSAWIESKGWDGSEYRALAAHIARTWETSGEPFPRVHSLFTQTLSAKESWATIYLRPYLPRA